MNAQKISVVGLGKLGLPLAACLAGKGYAVIGIDTDPDKVRLINEGKVPAFEPGLDELMRLNRERLTATDDYGRAVTNSAITFVVVPTPSDKDGGFSLKYVLDSTGRIGEALRKKNAFHVIVITSTVMPGSTESEIKPALERYSQKRCGIDFGLCYNPEFIALGSVIRDFLNPDFILIGESDERSGDILAKLYKNTCDNDPPIARMNFINAELTKLSLNTFITTKISYANMLAEVCRRLPGGDIDVVTSALGMDTRIGGKYLKGALGYGGPCFPRDNDAIRCLAGRLGLSFPIAEATDKINKMQVAGLKELILSKMPEGGRAGILGLSYKPDTAVVEESQGIELAKALSDEGIPVVVYDPLAMENAAHLLNGKVTFARSTEECIKNTDIIVVTVPWKEFKSIKPHYFAKKDTRPVLIDCWRILDKERLEKSAEYIPLGVHLQNAEHNNEISYSQHRLR